MISLTCFRKPISQPALLGLLGIVFLVGCDQPQKSAIKKEVVKEASAATPIGSAAADTVNPADCPRAAATPVAKRTIFADARFVLQPDHLTGIETFTLPKGDKITIKQSGCEYYVLNIQMETSRFAADTSDLLYWGDATLQLMREVNKGISTPLEISKGLNKLAARLQADKNSNNRLKPDEEIDFGGPDPREYLTVNRVSQLADQRFLLEVTFNYGPI